MSLRRILGLDKPARRGPKPKRPIARNSAPIKRAKAPAKKRKTTLAAMRRKLWALFALYVKERDGRKCFTCDAVVEGSFCHAGHMFSIGKASTAYDPANVHVQCGRCNVFLRGNVAVYAARFIDRYGIEKFQALHARQKVTHEWKPYQIEELIEALQRGGADYECLYEEKYGLCLVDGGVPTVNAGGLEPCAESVDRRGSAA